MISVTATAIRDGKAQEIAVSQLVPGDMVELAAGDMIPADVRMVTAKDLFVTQGSLTGESFPVEKSEIEKTSATTAPFDLTSIAFLGTSVESGSATAVVIATGKETFLGGVAHSLSDVPAQTAYPEQVEKPRPWDISQLTRFIVCIGPCSSIFDYTTHFMMLWVFNCWDMSTPAAAARSASLFQTGWFVESLLTQTLIIHIIRTNKIPFLQSRPS
jgi:magnesium-transporting ATPase (P-type)